MISSSSARRFSSLRFLTIFAVAGLLASVLTTVARVEPAAADADPVSVSQVHNGTVITTDLRHWNPTDFEVQVSNGPITKLKVEVEVFRAGDDPSVDLPYWEWVEGPVTSYTYVTSVDLSAPPNSFQPGTSFQWRARWWTDGDGGNPSEWSTMSTFATKAATGRPGSPYPVSPTGPIAPADNILRLEQTQAGQSELTDPITEYRFEVRVADTTTTRWTTTIPAPASPTEILEVAVPTLPADTSFQWRAFARTATATDNDSSGSSSPSRWRYFTTTGPQYQQEFWYVPDRAGSYQAGDTGDEVSGMVASRQYPGVYWMMRDNGPGDRARLYAIKIDPATGLLANIDGYATKEIDVVGATNLDWEAITLDANNNLWVADSGAYWDGDFQTRTEGLLHRIPEPNPYTATTATINKTAPYNFPPGIQFRNVEAVFTIHNSMFLVAKEEPHLVFQLPSYLSTAGNQLTNLGPLTAKVDNITDIDISVDMARLAITTSPKRVYVWENPNGPQAVPTTGAGARAIVEQFIDQDPDWHYYYRSAGALEADGLLYTRDGFDQQARQTGMQTEGVAFADTGNYELVMASEYGSHVMYVPTSSYETRQGVGGFSGDTPPTDDPALLADRLVPRASWWYYDDDGSTSTDWNQIGGDLSDYRIGTAQLGYGEGDETTVTTNDGHMTDYFVRTFTADPADTWALDLAMLVDDGAVVYINGTEVARFNMPNGTVTPATAAYGAWGTTETTPYFKQLDPTILAGLLQTGTNANVIAVEVHQNQIGSSDLTFDLELTTGVPFQPTQLDGKAVMLGTDRFVDLTWQTSSSNDAGLQEIWHRDSTNGDETFSFVRIADTTTTSVTIDVADDEYWAGEFIVLATSAQTSAEWCAPDAVGCTRPDLSLVTQVTEVVSAGPDSLAYFDASTPALNVSRTWTIPADTTLVLDRMASTNSSRAGRLTSKVPRYASSALGGPWGLGSQVFFDILFADDGLGGGDLLTETSYVSRTVDWNDLEFWADLNPDLVEKTGIYITVLVSASPATDAEDDDLKAQIDMACAALADDLRSCGDDDLAIYFPGGSDYNGVAMRDTGLHIHETLVTEPIFAGFQSEAYQGGWWSLERQRPEHFADLYGFKKQWYDKDIWQTNACTDRLPEKGVCDEFPFRSTNKVGDFSGVLASLQPTEPYDASPQGTDIRVFYSHCTDGNDGDPFLVISPPKSYIVGFGPSFGARVEVDPNGAFSLNRCHP